MRLTRRIWEARSRLITPAVLVLAGLVQLLLPRPQISLIGGDAHYYHAKALSLAFDLDLDLRNQYAELGDRWRHGERRVDPFPLGASLVSVPGLWVGRTVAAGLDVLRPAAAPHGRPTGKLMTHAAALPHTLLLAFALVQLVAFLRRRVGGEVAGWTLGFLLLATPALYFALVHPLYSHGASMALACLLVVHVLDRDGPPTGRDWALAGALVGAAALVRFQDAALGLVPCLAWLPGVRDERMAYLRGLAVLVLASAVISSPEGIRLLAAAQPPLGPAYLRWGSPETIQTLFGTRNGLYSTHPILLVATLGWLLTRRFDGRVRLGCLACLGATTYLAAAATDYWGGFSLGARRFLGLAPLFALGLAGVLAVLWSRPPRERRLWRVAVATLLLLLGGFNVARGVDLARLRVNGEAPDTLPVPTLGTLAQMPGALWEAVRQRLPPGQFAAMSRQLLLTPDFVTGCPGAPRTKVSLRTTYGRGLVVSGAAPSERGVAFARRMALRLPLHCLGPMRLRMGARGAGSALITVQLRFDGRPVGAFPLPVGRGIIDVEIPAPGTRYPLLELSSSAPLQISAFEVSVRPPRKP